MWKKKHAVSLGFFSYFTWDYLLKQEVMVVKSSELTFMAIIARMSNFKDVRAKLLPNLGQKWHKTDNIQ